MSESSLEILDVLGGHFSNAIAEPNEALEKVVSEIEEHHSIDRYDFVRKLGEGGLKKVTLEKDKVTHREVAISSLAEKQPVEEVLRFINEAYLTARLGHNNIVPQHTIVAHMYIGHEEIVISYDCFALILNGTTVDRNTFSDRVVITDYQTRGLTAIF